MNSFDAPRGGAPQDRVVEDLLTHTAWLRRLAGSLVSNDHDVDDLVQDTVTVALQHPPQSRGPGFLAWCRRVMSNRVGDDRRRAARRERVTAGVGRAAESVESAAPSAHSVVERTELQSLLIQAVLDLEEPYKSTVLARFVDEETSDAIASRLGIPASTVRNRLRRGLERVRERLRAHHGEDARWLPGVVAVARGRDASLTCQVSSQSATGAETGLRCAFSLSRAHGVALLAGALLGLVTLGYFSQSPGAWESVPLADDSTNHDGEDVTAGERQPTIDRNPATTRSEMSRPGEAIAPGLELTVWNHDGSPAVGAWIHWIAEPEAHRRNEREGGREHPHNEDYRHAAWAEAYGDSVVTDDTGRAKVPIPAARLLVAARCGVEYGATSISTGSARGTLQLQREEKLRIRCRDREGEPVSGVPIRIAARVGAGAQNSLWVGRSDSDGEVEIPHFQMLRPSRGANDESLTEVRYGVGCEFPHAAPAPVEFGEPIPREPIELTVPDHGFVRLVFADGEGRAVPTPASFYRLAVRFPVREPSVERSALPRREKVLHGRRSRVDAAPILRRVGLGAEIETSGQFAPAGDLAPAKFDGPVLRDQIVDHVMGLESRWGVVLGRVVDSEGKPLSLEASMTAVVIGRENDRRPVGLLRGQDSQFALPVRCDKASPLTLWIRAEVTPLPLGASVDLRALRAGGRLEAGVIELAPLAEVMIGNVVDDRADPVIGAQLELSRATDTTIIDRRFAGRSGEGGRFSISGVADRSPRFVRARAKGYLSEFAAPVFDAGGQRVRVTVVREASLQRGLLVPAWLTSQDVILRATSLREGAVPIEVAARARTGRVAARLRRLWPDRYALDVAVRGEPSPFLSLGTIDVAAGAAIRLDDVDLRLRLHLVEIVLCDPEGHDLSLPGAGVQAMWGDAGGERVAQNLIQRDGRWQITSSRSRVPIVVQALGFDRVETVVGEGENRVTMRRTR